MAFSRTRADAHALTGPARARRKFLAQFPGCFRDERYLDRERDYKVAVHKERQRALGPSELRALLDAGAHEKMALRDAVKSRDGARAFVEGLYRFLHGPGAMERASRHGGTRSKRCRPSRRAC